MEYGCGKDHLRHYSNLHAALNVQVPEPAEGKRKESAFLATLSTASSGFSRAALPPTVRTHFEVPLKKTVVRLMPQPPGPNGGHRTAVEVVATVELAKLTFLGPARHIAPPSWLVRIIIRVLIPYVWSQFLNTLGALNTQSTELAKTFAQRIREDSTGIYAFVQGQKARSLTGSDAQPAPSSVSHPQYAANSAKIIAEVGEHKTWAEAFGACFVKLAKPPELPPEHVVRIASRRGSSSSALPRASQEEMQAGQQRVIARLKQKSGGYRPPSTPTKLGS